MNEVYDGLRWINLALALWAVFRLLESRVRKWKRVYTDKEQVLWYALVGSAVIGGEAALENLLQDNPGGPRVIGTTIYLIFIIWGTYMKDAPKPAIRRKATS